uniref:Uncharacterized protein n=1 Tax=Oryza brachyantha TaxID=4533 RepID=J3LZV4_ORYBR
MEMLLETMRDDHGGDGTRGQRATFTVAEANGLGVGNGQCRQATAKTVNEWLENEVCIAVSGNSPSIGHGKDGGMVAVGLGKGGEWERGSEGGQAMIRCQEDKRIRPCLVLNFFSKNITSNL